LAISQTARDSSRHHLQAHLELEVGQDGNEVGVPAPLPDPVHGSLHLGRPRPHGGQRIRDGGSGVVVGVDAQTRSRESACDPAHDLLDLPGERHSPVGLAQDQPIGAALHRRSQRGEGVFGVRLPAVEEMLGVVDHLAARVLEVGQRVPDHGEIFLAAHAQDLVHMQIPALAEDGDHGTTRLQQTGQSGIVGCGPAGSARGTEASDPGLLPFDLPGPAEEFHVQLVGGIGPAAFDVPDPEPVQELRDRKLVFQGKGQASGLVSIAQSGVEKLHVHRFLVCG